MMSSGLSASSRTRKRALGVNDKGSHGCLFYWRREGKTAGVSCETAGALRLPALRDGGLQNGGCAALTRPTRWWVVKRRVRYAYPPDAMVGCETAGALRLRALRDGGL